MAPNTYVWMWHIVTSTHNPLAKRKHMGKPYASGVEKYTHPGEELKVTYHRQGSWQSKHLGERKQSLVSHFQISTPLSSFWV